MKDDKDIELTPKQKASIEATIKMLKNSKPGEFDELIDKISSYHIEGEDGESNTDFQDYGDMPSPDQEDNKK